MKLKTIRRLMFLIKSIVLFIAFMLTSEVSAADYRVGYQNSMRKIFHQNEKQDGTLSFPSLIKIYLAKNEYEGFQVVISAEGKDLTGVQVSLSNLSDGSGHTISQSEMLVSPVGYVQTKTPSKSTSDSWTGWWPDPILDFMSSINVQRGQLQPFLVLIHSTKATAVAVYQGNIIVQAANSSSTSIPLEVHIWDFTLPTKPTLPVAMSFDEGMSMRAVYGDKYNNEIRDRYYDFLYAYKINPDNIYGGAPSADVLNKFNQTYWLGPHNTGELTPAVAGDAAAFNDFISKTRSRLDSYRQYGLEEGAYIYALDEVGEVYSSLKINAFNRLNQEFPNIPIMSTSVEIKNIDKYSNIEWPVVMYDPELEIADATIESARSAGRKIWWYTSDYPPRLNFSLENPLVNCRILMGALAYKYKPDGYLYWIINRWFDNSAPVTSGPLTSWNPVTFPNFNGIGSLFYPGSNGPISSLRINAFRDGVEDYEYYILLQSVVDQNKNNADANLIAQANQVLSVTSDLVKSFWEFTNDPQMLLNNRQKTADLILELSGGAYNPGPTDLMPPNAPVGIKVGQ